MKNNDESLNRLLNGIKNNKESLEEIKEEKKGKQIRKKNAERINKLGQIERIKSISLTEEQLKKIEELQFKISNTSFMNISFMQIMKIITSKGIESLEEELEDSAKKDPLI